MTTRPAIHIDVQLPELSPTQADLLWNVINDLTNALWDAYADELLEVDCQRQYLLDVEEDWADSEVRSEDAEEASEHDVTNPLTAKQEPSPDL